MKQLAAILLSLCFLPGIALGQSSLAGFDTTGGSVGDITTQNGIVYEINEVIDAPSGKYVWKQRDADVQTATVNTVSDLNNLVTLGLADDELAITLGRYVIGDNGGTTYVYQSTGRTGVTIDEVLYVTGPGADDYFEVVDKFNAGQMILMTPTGSVEPTKGFVPSSDMTSKAEWGAAIVSAGADALFTASGGTIRLPKDLEATTVAVVDFVTTTGDAYIEGNNASIQCLIEHDWVVRGRASAGNVVIRNLNVDGGATTGLDNTGGTRGEGIRASLGTTDTTIRIENCVVENCPAGASANGIWVGGSAGSTTFITDCTVRNPGYSCYQLNGVGSTQIMDNCEGVINIDKFNLGAALNGANRLLNSNASGGGSIIVSNCAFECSIANTGAVIDPGTGAEIDSLTLRDVRFDITNQTGAVNESNFKIDEVNNVIIDGFEWRTDATAINRYGLNLNDTAAVYSISNINSDSSINILSEIKSITIKNAVIGNATNAIVTPIINFKNTTFMSLEDVEVINLNTVNTGVFLDGNGSASDTRVRYKNLTLNYTIESGEANYLWWTPADAEEIKGENLVLNQTDVGTLYLSNNVGPRLMVTGTKEGELEWDESLGLSSGITASTTVPYPPAFTGVVANAGTVIKNVQYPDTQWADNGELIPSWTYDGTNWIPDIQRIGNDVVSNASGLWLGLPPGVVSERTGSGNSATTVGTITLVDPPLGLTGKAYQTSDANYFTLPSNILAGATEWTVGGYVKATTMAGAINRAPFFGNFNADGLPIFYFSNTGITTTNAWRVWANGSNGFIDDVRYDNDPGDDTWVYIAGVYDGTDFTFYIDGETAIQTNASGVINASGVLQDSITEPPYIGARAAGTGWPGAIYGAFAFSRALTPNEINHMYDAYRVDDAPNIVNTVADLANAAPVDGEEYATLGYNTAGDGGGNTYLYDAGSSATIDNGFVIDGPGSVGRYIAIDQTKVELRKFGAVADDTTDAYAIFKTAVATAEANAVPLVVDGKFYLDNSASASTVSAPLEIIGKGQSVSQLRGADNTRQLLTAASGASLSLRNIAVSAASAVMQIDAVAFGDLYIDGCSFTNMGFGPIASSTTQTSIGEVTLTNNTLTTVAQAAGGLRYALGVRSTTVGSVVISNNSITTVGNNTHNNAALAIYVASTTSTDNEQILIANNNIRDVQNNSTSDCGGIIVLGGTCRIIGNHVEDVFSSSATNVDQEGIYTKCHYSVIANNTLRNAGGREACIAVKGDASRTGAAQEGNDNIIANNNIIRTAGLSNQRSTAIGIEDMEGLHIVNNKIRGTTKGISIANDCTDVEIFDNTMEASIGSGATPLTDFHVAIETASANNIRIEGNTIRDWGFASTTGGSYGIYLNHSASLTDELFVVADNVIDNLISAGSERAMQLSISGTSTIERVEIRDNIFRTADIGYYIINGDQVSGDIVVTGNRSDAIATPFLLATTSTYSAWDNDFSVQQTLGVDVVADLATYIVPDETIVATAGYTTTNDGGGNTYVYDASSSATVDGGFVINGPGGVGRYLAVDQTVANVKQFGATGDGVTDDTTVVRNALNTAVSNDIELLFPTGDYILTSWATHSTTGDTNILISKTATVDGDGSNTFIRRLASHNTHIYGGGTITGFTFPVYLDGGVQLDLVINDITINGGQDGIVHNDNLTSMTKLHVKNCEITGQTRSGLNVQVEGVITDCQITGNEIHDVTSTADVFGILVGDNVVASTNVGAIISGNNIYNITTSASAEAKGILHYGSNCVIANNTIKNVTAAGGTEQEGIYVKTAYCTIANNVLEDAGSDEGAITFKGNDRAGSNPAIPLGVVRSITGNIIRYSTSFGGKGITFTEADDLLVSNNVLENVSRPFSAVQQPNVTITGNLIRNCNSTVFQALDTTDVTFSNNRIYGLDNSTGASLFIMRVQATSSDCSRITVKDNYFSSTTNTSGSGFNMGMATLSSTGNTVSDCLFEGNYIDSGFEFGYGGYESGGTISDIVLRNNDINASTKYTATLPAVPNGTTVLEEIASDPVDPPEGQTILWQSNGSGTGDDGEVLAKTTAGGVTTVYRRVFDRTSRKEAQDTETFSATPTFDFEADDADNKTVILTGNITSSTFTATRPGKYIIVFVQDGTGNRTVVFPAALKGNPPQPNTVANSSTVYEFYYDGTSFHF